MASENLNFNIGADVSDFLKGIEKVQDKLKSVGKNTGEVVKAAGELADQLTETFVASPVFKELDKLTGGLAGGFVNLGKAAVAAFRSIQIGSALAKAALVATGIGAIVVLLGTVAAQWDNIKTAITGVNFEQRLITERLAEQVKKQQQVADLITSQDNTLKLQGKTQKQINNIKLKELGILLEIKKAQLSNFQDSLSQAQKTQDTYAKVINTVVRALTEPFKLLPRIAKVSLTQISNAIAGFAPDTSEILKKGALILDEAEKGIDRIADKFSKVITPDLTTDLKEEVAATELEVAKLQNTIDGIKLDNLAIDKSSNVTLFSPETLENLQKGISIFGSIPDIVAKGTQSLQLFSGTITQEALKLAEIGTALFEQISETAAQFAQGTLGGIAESIGAALASGQNVIQVAGQQLLGSLGAFLSEVGGLFIKFGFAAKAFAAIKAAISKGGPIAIALGAGGLIAAGLALKAIGGAISSAAAGGGGGAGGFSGGATGGQDFSNGRSFSRREQTEQVVVFKISGQNLIGVLRNANDQNLRIAGANTLSIN